VLVEAIRLTKRADAFTSDYTPFSIIRQILEREGEFNECQDEMTFSFGGFGLNYVAVGPVRESALDYLDCALEGNGSAALQAVYVMEDLLHNYLNRVVRESSEDEIKWQHRERERCLQALLRRYQVPGSTVLKAKIYDALRSATGINCPDMIRQTAKDALDEIVLDDAVAVVDAICTAEHELPLVSKNLTEADWDCLGRLISTDSADDYAELFWDVAGYDESSLRLILEIAPNVEERGVENIAILLGRRFHVWHLRIRPLPEISYRISLVKVGNVSWGHSPIKRAVMVAEYLQDIQRT
jgi:hypothetical protein